MWSYFLVYILLRLDEIKIAFFIVALITGTLFVICAINVFDNKHDEVNRAIWKRFRNLYLTLCIGCVTLNVIVPSAKQTMIIVGGGLTIQALQTPEAREIGGKIIDLIQQRLDEQLQDSKQKQSQKLAH